MWTPRRVLVLVFGFVACAAIFGVYYRFLGWIDGLPTLPEKYRASSVQTIRPDLPPDEPIMLRRIKQAFGERCPELGYTIKLTVQSQEILLVTDQVEIQPDGRIKLTPFSLAIFGNKRLDNGFPEINVVHCDIALVAFDRKIETLSDMGKSKIIAAEFIGDKNILSSDPRKGAIHVVNNHGTPQRDDD